MARSRNGYKNPPVQPPSRASSKPQQLAAWSGSPSHGENQNPGLPFVDAGTRVRKVTSHGLRSSNASLYKESYGPRSSNDPLLNHRSHGLQPKEDGVAVRAAQSDSNGMLFQEGRSKGLPFRNGLRLEDKGHDDLPFVNGGDLRSLRERSFRAVREENPSRQFKADSNGGQLKEEVIRQRHSEEGSNAAQLDEDISRLHFKEHFSDVAQQIKEDISKSIAHFNTLELDVTGSMVKAKELKEEGNRQFQKKDYAGALASYKQALELTPSNHSDRAVFHSNRAACLMQMQPVQHDAAIQECNLALEAHPGFSRALLRRAKAYEALGKLDLALEDVEMLLQSDGNHPDALDLNKRLCISLYNLEEGQQNLQGKHTASFYTRSASAIHRGPPLQERPSASQYIRSASDVFPRNEYVGRPFSMRDPTIPNFDERLNAVTPPPRPLSKCPEHAMRSFSLHGQPPSQEALLHGKSTLEPLETALNQTVVETSEDKPANTVLMRPLKLIYHDDIRLAEMPANCKFNELRKLVRDRFPSSKAVLMKYKDMEGDLVTITSSDDLRLAEGAAVIEATKKVSDAELIKLTSSSSKQSKAAIGLPDVLSTMHPVRLYVVEVPPEQEPIVKGEDALAKECIPMSEEFNLRGKETDASHCHGRGKGMTMHKWLMDFAHLFHTHLGIDTNALADLQDRGMELCSEALEEAITCEKAEPLFVQAASKFQEAAARAFFNLGNIHMCAARKQIPHDSTGANVEFYVKLQAAFDWAQVQFELAQEKFEKALQVKADYAEVVLALGQKDFENAKLHWSLAVARQVNLGIWDASRTLELFKNAEEKVQRAANILERVDECDTCEYSEERKTGSTEGEFVEQVRVTRHQMYLFWGNLFYEHSQVEYRLGLSSWNRLLEAAVLKFEVAGVSPSDLSNLIQKHLSMSSALIDETSAGGLDNQGSIGHGVVMSGGQENASEGIVGVRP